MEMQNVKSTGLSLLKKGKKGVIRAIFSRLGLILVLLVVQLLFMFSIFHFISIFRWFEAFLPHILGGSVLFSSVMVLYLLNSQIDPTAKITWLIVIMLVPVFGALLLLYTESDIGHRALKDRLHKLVLETKECIPQKDEVMEAFSEKNPGAASLAHYIHRSGCYPVFDGTAVTYFPIGENMFDEMLKELEQAKDFIFLEFFIVDEGLMWGKILEILARKAAQGVDVRVMYDGTCEFSTLPHDYPKRLKALGSSARCFLL